MKKDYKEIVKQNLEQSHKFTQSNIALLEIINENINLKIEKMQDEIKQNNALIQDQNTRDEKYNKVINITNNNCTVSKNMTNNQVSAVTLEQSKNEKANNVQVGNDAIFN